MKQEELERIKKEIRTYEQRLNESKKAERSTLDRIDTYSKQTSLIRMVLSDLNMRINGNKQQIDDAVVRLKQAERDLKHLQDGYARSIVNAYKRGRTHDTELLLSSTSLNQMFIRSKYLRAFSSRQRREADRIRETRQAVVQQKTALECKVQEQQQTVAEKKGEEKTLQRNLDQSKDLLGKVRKDKESYRAELQRKQSAAAKIERLIADLIERERMKRLAASAKKDRSLADADKNTSTRRLGGKIVELPGKPISETAFGRLKGRLPWPVTHGAVVGGFGEQVHPKLGTVTISNGIDIQVETGTPVRAVADGVVSMTYFIAGYGNLIILNHDDGFFTVYAHLSDINVRQGAHVKAGQSLARSAESLSGSQIHFELWRERAKQNPLLWLSHR